MSFDPEEHERRCQATFDARDAAWASFGEIDPYVLAPLINPAFAGGPVWPNLRQAYKTVRGPLGTLFATDGLSDPFDDSWNEPPPQNGFAMEVYTIADVVPAPELKQSWVFALVAGFADQVARHGHVHRLLAELGTISSELYDVPIPPEHRARFVNEHERVGILVGLEDAAVPTWVEGPVSPIRLTSLKLLTLAELRHILAHGEAGRAELVERFRASAAPLVSSLTRPSVIPETA